jgi:hypothetical protein
MGDYEWLRKFKRLNPKNIVGKFRMEAEIPQLHQYIGRMVKIPGVETPVMIGTICGNLGLTLRGDMPRPQYYEINGKYLISMLRFHAQMTGATDITEEQFRAFESIEWGAEKMPGKKIVR